MWGGDLKLNCGGGKRKTNFAGGGGGSENKLYVRTGESKNSGGGVKINFVCVGGGERK